MIDIIKKYNIKAKKSLGQNFLVNEEVIDNIANVINVDDENIIEVGPGFGVLTQKLLNKKLNSLTLVELDKDMIDIIKSRIDLGELNIKDKNFEIKNIDVLKFIPEPKKYSVIANIPYYITSPILRHFLYNVEIKPDKMVILMQKEVGDKILGDFKNKFSMLSLLMFKKSNIKEVLFVGKENFSPQPKVESSVLLFETHNDYDFIDDDYFIKIMKIAFTNQRKKLIKNLEQGGFDKNKLLGIFTKMGISENVRGEELSIKIWCELIKNIK